MHLTKRSYILLGSSLVLVGALIWGAATYASSPAPMMVPKQTPIHITLNQTLASNRSKPGQHFEATVSEPVMLDGKTVMVTGADVVGPPRVVAKESVARAAELQRDDGDDEHADEDVPREHRAEGEQRHPLDREQHQQHGARERGEARVAFGA